MHHPENGTVVQTVLEVNLVAVSVKLFIALSSSESVGMARSIFFFCIFLLDYRM